MDENKSFEEIEKSDSPERAVNASSIRSIRDLIDRVTGRNLNDLDTGDAGFAEHWPFPFLAIIGQKEMKLGLLLALINPNIGGGLLVGPRGPGKTTSVRSLIDLMPYVYESNCYYGCIEDDVAAGGLESLCPNCVEKYEKGDPLSALRPAKLVDLPLNAKLEDVLGSVDERSDVSSRLRVRRGILSHADRNLLYIDEVNLLKDEVVDVILDAAAQGSYTVRRERFSATYHSRFSLVGTMNPEEGTLRPQILDRFGLRILVKGLEDEGDRLEAYERARAYLSSPKQFVDLYSNETLIAREEVGDARELLPKVKLPEEVSHRGLALIREMGIPSLRAEITLFEAARALAAADARNVVTLDDLETVAVMSLRLRRSPFIDEYLNQQETEDKEIISKLSD